ncbi:MAG: nickel pincer cofactor biosynthesis protein LarB [Deltaproteobacteria bacterium]|nr:MAG: nickel pincer cofactor biosynthesis protein LarB [Deltaproteobacteria bacterium]
MRLRQLLERLARGDANVDEVEARLRELPFERLGDMATVDHHRELRVGVPEVVLGQTKTADQIAALLQSLARHGNGALATRVDPEKAAAVASAVDGAIARPDARAVVVPPERPRPPGRGPVAVVSAGTSDEPVAAEAAVTLEFLGQQVVRVCDVGVAGVHRLIDRAAVLRAAEVVIVVAGMEGALPSVVAGLIDRPVIAVPTSVGYGVSAGGFVALLGMLSSCAPGVTVVNIDNGFGAAVAATLINRVRDA